MKNKPAWFHLLFQRKMLLILMLGFASGLPLGLSGTTLQAWYTMADVDIVTIGFLSLVGQPYVYKFVWAPLLDKWRLPFLGLRRGWIIATQCGLSAILCWMGFSDPANAPGQLAFLALCLAFLSATQDIAYDAYRTEMLTEKERGLGIAMTTYGYRIAMLVSTSLTLIIAHYTGFSFAYFLMAALMLIGVIATLLGKEPEHHRLPEMPFVKACMEPFKEFLSRKNAIILLFFIVLYKLGDAFAGSLTTSFLLKGVGFTLQDVGVVNKLGGILASLCGVFVGGLLLNKLGMFKALLWFGICQAVTNLLFYGLTFTGPHYGMLVLTVCGENFAGGLGTAAFMGFVMSLCNLQHTATQFALFSAIAAIGRVFTGPSAGILVNTVGWDEFFLWSVVVALPGLILLLVLRSTINQYDNTWQEQEATSAVLAS
ncbi:MAG: AmpG family muropeptide MFS transporter [Candidatus Berkiellales bacterium]